MAIDPICKMSVTEQSVYKVDHDGKTVYFCSDHCLKTFLKDHSSGHPEGASCCDVDTQPWYRRKTVVALAVFFIFFAATWFFPFLTRLRFHLGMYFNALGWAIALGLVIGGIIDYYVPKEYISRILTAPRKRTIFYAVFLGAFASVCSCGVLALSMQLHKKGASTAAVVAFLLASPWANFPLTLMMVGFFGLLPALYIVFSAVCVALMTGLIYLLLERKGWVERNKNTVSLNGDFSVREDFRKRWREYRWSAKQIYQDLCGIGKGISSLADMIVWWLLIGVVVASLVATYVPTEIFTRYLGPTLSGMLLTMLLATVLEVCSEGSAPLAFEMFRQTGALGNSFVFLMGGVITDYNELGLLWHNVGRRAAIWLPIITIPQVLFFGYVANLIFFVIH